VTAGVGEKPTNEVVAPSQMVVAPPANANTVGNAVTVTVEVAVLLHPFASVPVTV
jgi:hypothetical protein